MLPKTKGGFASSVLAGMIAGAKRPFLRAGLDGAWLRAGCVQRDPSSVGESRAVLGWMEPDSRAHDAILEAVERSHCRALGQYISLLIKRVDGKQFEDSVSNLLAYPMPAHIDVLGS